MNLQVPLHAGNFWTSWGTVSFSEGRCSKLCVLVNPVMCSILHSLACSEENGDGMACTDRAVRLLCRIE